MAARVRFREFIEKREAPAAIAFPGKVSAVSNIPIRVPTHFLGRDDALAAIETAIGRYDGHVAITALHGLRGVGKTTLAAAYAERHRGDYRATWWIRAQTEPGMRADLVGARRAARLGRGRRQGGAGARHRDGAAAARGRGHLAHLRQRGRCRCAQALSAARRARPCSGHVERACLARGGGAGRNPAVAEGDRRRLPRRAHRARRRARRGLGAVGGARRAAARARAGGRLLRAARHVSGGVRQALRAGAGTAARRCRAMRRPSITTA